MSVSGRAPSAKKFRRIELSTAHTGRKSSASVTLALCGIALLPLAQGCFFAQQDALPQGDLKYFSTTGAFGGQCVARELCNASYGLRECSKYSRYAIPAFDTREECEVAFKGTSLAVQCVDMEFGTPGISECEPRTEKVTVVLDESSEASGNSVGGTQDTELETMECKKLAPAATVKKLYIPEAGSSWFSRAEMGSDTAGWFGGLQNEKTGREVQPFQPTDAAQKEGYNPSAKVSGYFVRGEPAQFSQGRLELLKSSLLACPEVSSNADFKREVDGLLAVAKAEAGLNGGGPGAGAGTGALAANGSNLAQGAANAGGQVINNYGSGTGSFWTMFLLMQAFRPPMFSPFGGYGYGFSGAPRYLTNGVTGGLNYTRPNSPVYVSRQGADGLGSPLAGDRVQAGVANKDAISKAGGGAPGAAGAPSKPVVKASSIRSGGFGTAGRSGASYNSGGSRGSYSGRNSGGSFGGSRGGGSMGG